jgi:hypothetical protein
MRSAGVRLPQCSLGRGGSGYNLITMLTEKVWQRIKNTAERDATERSSLSFPEAEKVVKRIIQSEDGPFPQPAVEFYARELIRLTEEARIVPNAL